MTKSAQHVVVDIIRCDGHGYCAELVPERISLDDWGYPIVDPTPMTADILAHARRAVAECPLLAVRIVESDGTTTPSRTAGVNPARP